MADNIQGGAGDGPDDFKMPSKEQILAAINSMSELTEEQRKELLDSIADNKLGGGAVPSPIAAPTRNLSVELVWMLFLLSIVFIILVFFGYKLYKSLVDRERRREEKKRQKLQKKKK